MQPLGDGAARFDRPRGVSGRALLELLRRWPRVLDVVVTEEHYALYFDPRAVPADPTSAVARLAATADPAGRLVTIPASYDGPDLDDVAASTGLSRDEVVRAHEEAEYVVSMVGFLPGFAYLRGVSDRLMVPRRATPRARVPALAIGIAAGYTGVYPCASPGGWNLIANAVEFTPFDPERGSTLAIGDRVRFERVG
jgi:UPF0271 protein